MKRGTLALVAALAMSSLALANERLICRLAPGVTPAMVSASYGIPTLDWTFGAPFAYFSLPSGVNGDTMRILMTGDARIVWADDEAGISAQETQGVQKVDRKGSTLPAIGDRYALYDYNSTVLAQIHWSQALNQTPGRAVRVAILDTGLSRIGGDTVSNGLLSVTSKASAKAPSYLWRKVVAAINTIDSPAPANDVPRHEDSNADGKFDFMTGHGTMVAGIVDQMSPQSKFVICRVADSDGQATAWSVIKGLAFAVTQGAEVANISLGTLNRVTAMTDVLDWCDAQGLLVVAAIGNNGLRAACNPAGIHGVVCVGGLLPTDAKAPFSNFDGSCVASAPATGIISQDWDGTLGIWSGTSFAAPMATGMVAEALRRTSGPILPSKSLAAFRTFGNDLDSLNPTYRGELGYSLDYSRFILGYGPNGPAQRP